MPEPTDRATRAQVLATTEEIAARWGNPLIVPTPDLDWLIEQVRALVADAEQRQQEIERLTLELRHIAQHDSHEGDMARAALSPTAKTEETT